MGRYRVEAILGRGGMAVVFAARDERANRNVAIKILEVEGETHTERFLRESKVAARLASPHIAELYEVGAHLGKPVLVMERLEGADFGALVRQGPLALADVADCVVQTCEPLAIAHGAGIVHRDIKASNLFLHERLGGGAIVKVLDFGISKFLEPYGDFEYTLTRTREGAFLGSPPYMSPEQFRNPRNVDGRADLWSLGVVAFRLLSTQFPFAGETSVEVFAAILETDPRPLRSFGIDVPDAVDAAIRKCLTRAREDRFANAGELARAFAPFASPQWQSLADRIVKLVTQRPASLLESTPGLASSGPRRIAREPHTVTVAPPTAPPKPPDGDDRASVPSPPSAKPAVPRAALRTSRPAPALPSGARARHPSQPPPARTTAPPASPRTSLAPPSAARPSAIAAPPSAPVSVRPSAPSGFPRVTPSSGAIAAVTPPPRMTPSGGTARPAVDAPAPETPGEPHTLPIDPLADTVAYNSQSMEAALGGPVPSAPPFAVRASRASMPGPSSVPPFASVPPVPSAPVAAGHVSGAFAAAAPASHPSFGAMPAAPPAGPHTPSAAFAPYPTAASASFAEITSKKSHPAMRPASRGPVVLVVGLSALLGVIVMLVGIRLVAAPKTEAAPADTPAETRAAPVAVGTAPQAGTTASQAPSTPPAGASAEASEAPSAPSSTVSKGKRVWKRGPGTAASGAPGRKPELQPNPYGLPE